ncbi:MAG: PCRF domain-containing protein, partial [Candidatus Promineifilaceae bacterium]
MKNSKVQLPSCGGGFDLDAKSEKLASLQMAAAEPGFWDDQEKAQGVMRDITKLQNEVGIWNRLRKHLDDTLELASLEDEALEEDLTLEVAQLEEETYGRVLVRNGL